MYLDVIQDDDEEVTKSARYYVDLFAGPGRDEIRPGQRQIDGSPLRALSLQRGNFTKYILVENKPSYFQALTKRVSTHDRGTSAEVLSGDCNELVEQIVQEIPQGSPVFLFVDPRGLDIHWQTVQRFAAHRHLDMLTTC